MQPESNTPYNTPNPPVPGPVLPPVNSSPRNNHDGLRSIVSTLLILLIAPLLALGITAFVFQSYEVDGPSMEPTLKTQQRLIIWKANRTWAKLTNNEFIPGRGSIVVFVKKGMFNFDSNKEKQLIKRVIALPGERVVVKDGTITVYNDSFPNGFNPDSLMDYGKEINEPTDGIVDITLGAGEIFVCGDNRDNSLDSRSFGAVPAEDIVGTLSARILPLSEAERF